MLAYHYDPTTFAYLHNASEADPDPLDPDNWLIPASSTLLVPPSPPDPNKQQAVFRDGAWKVEDIPGPSAIAKNIGEAPHDMWPRMSIREALKGGVS